MWALAVILVLMAVEPSLAAEVNFHDGDSLTLGNTRYRLHGIDAPELARTWAGLCRLRFPVMP
jgi:endonuclease YncB( thermonuclease family)